MSDDVTNGGVVENDVLRMQIKAPMGTTQYNTIVNKNCTIVLYLRFFEKSYGTIVPSIDIILARNS